MKDYFIRLFGYDRYANTLICQSMEQASRPEKAVQLMAHLLVTQQSWLGRCRQQPLPGLVVWPDWQADRFATLIEENHTAWVSYLQGLQATDFDTMVPYRNTKGAAFSNTIADITAHVINHGTHHRAQIGQVLKQAGLAQLPATDYIFYLRDHKSA